MIDLYEYSLLTIFLVGLAAILICSEIGHQIGLRSEGKGRDNIGTLESGALGLLALMIGFTFAMALSLYESRRDAVLNEANAIGTTALRARLLPEPYRSDVLKSLREYVQIRLDITSKSASRQELASALQRSNALQEIIWQQTKAAAAKDNAMVPTGLFIQSLNEMIDNQGKRLSALRNRVPNIVFLALFSIAAVAGGFAGYGSGLEAQRTRWPVLITGCLVAGVIILILDLDRPSAGFIEVSQQPMIDTAESLTGFRD